MRTTMLWSIAVLVTIVGPSSRVHGQMPQTRLTGLMHDYTPSLDASGPWQVVGEWSLTLNRASGKADFVAFLSMVRAETQMRTAHTHHVSLSDGQVTELANGYRITGTAAVTLNGSLAPFSGSPIEIEITGGSAVPLANVAVTVAGAAASHFGMQPLEGVIMYP